MENLNNHFREIKKQTDSVADYNNLHSIFRRTDIFQVCLRQVLGDGFIATDRQYSFVGRKALNWVTDKLLQKGKFGHARSLLVFTDS